MSVVFVCLCIFLSIAIEWMLAFTYYILTCYLHILFMKYLTWDNTYIKSISIELIRLMLIPLCFIYSLLQYSFFFFAFGAWVYFFLPQTKIRFFSVASDRKNAFEFYSRSFHKRIMFVKILYFIACTKYLIYLLLTSFAQIYFFQTFGDFFCPPSDVVIILLWFIWSGTRVACFNIFFVCSLRKNRTRKFWSALIWCRTGSR